MNETTHLRSTRYYDEINHPMDFGTVQKNLDAGRYKTLESFSKDVEQIFINCRLFNPPLTPPVQCADVVEKAWKKELAKAQEKKVGGNDKRALQGLMTKLMKEEHM
jgi:transcription initiation factor TFIID subunit 2